MRKMNIAGLIALLVLAYACSPTPPWSKWMEKGPPPGKEYTPLYVDGWKDGCHTGISAGANQWYKMYYKFRQDPLLAQNAIYYKGWKDAFDYCSRWAFQAARRPFF